MFFRSIPLFLAGLMTALLLTACGNGEPAPAPTGLQVTAGESSATLTWDMVGGVEYWVFFAPTSVAPHDVGSMQAWFGLPGGNVLLKVTSPYVVQGLTNATDYTFSINGRIDGGPGGSGATPVTATPRVAGFAWTAGTAAGSQDLRGAAYGSVTNSSTALLTPTYLAVGAAGTLFSSLDGASWSAINYATSSNLNGASYLGNYKVVGDGGTILTSSDVVTWTKQTSGTTQNLYAIANNGLNLNVAVGAAGTILTSSDGVTWTAASNSATTRDLYAVNYSSYNSGTWVAVGAGGTIVTSSDGLTWKSLSSGAAADLRGIANLATASTTTGVISATFVAVGASGTVLSSTDAATWTAQALPGASANLNAIVYGSQFVAAGSGGKILYSTDGLSWTAATTTTPANSSDLNALAHGPDRYLAVGVAGTNLLSK